ncbi:hypothetical protein BE17_04850 [Sorangium cellulosum]|uniref:Uncharacterized protein n=1 Tax=Sorangium cellulosum TaxID=56 RepID=A0A150S7H2_SORCE|nr:hypothetical protein BE17_04850 [Sorangium cellulosum]
MPRFDLQSTPAETCFRLLLAPVSAAIARGRRRNQAADRRSAHATPAGALVEKMKQSELCCTSRCWLPYLVRSAK